MAKLELTLIGLNLIFVCYSSVEKQQQQQNKCAFPPIPEGGYFKVLNLYPRKIVQYFCHEGYHLWGGQNEETILACDPDRYVSMKGCVIYNSKLRDSCVTVATLLTLTTEHRGCWHRPRYK
jgi:hypothetical protein